MILCLGAALIGCQGRDNSPVTFGRDNSPATVSGSDLTADDLAHARGIRWWIVDVPDVPEGQTLSLAFVDDYGIVDSRGCPEVKAGEQVKVVLSGFSEWNLRYSLVVGDRAYRSTILNYFAYIDGGMVKHLKSRTVGDPLLSKTDIKWVNEKSEPIEGRKLTVTMMFQEEVQNWPRNRNEDNWWNKAYAEHLDDGKANGKPFVSD